MTTLLISLTCGAFLVLGISYFTYFQCFRADPKRRDEPFAEIRGKQYRENRENMLSATRIMLSSKSEDVSITSHDGLRLCGKYYHTKDGAPLQIVFHGYRSLAQRDCTGSFILAKKIGFNVLAVDQRSHAKSAGHAIAFGILERKDCVAWAEYAAQRFGKDTPIILSGLSMGGATVLMASALPLPANVCCVIADCPFSSAKTIIKKVCRDRKLPDTLSYPFIRIGARVFGGFSLEEASAEEAVKDSKLPILLIHGEDDRFVPCDMSRAIYHNCCTPVQLHTFPGAGHCLSYMTDPIRYEDVNVRFLWEIPALHDYLEKSDFVQKQLRGEMQY